VEPHEGWRSRRCIRDASANPAPVWVKQLGAYVVLRVRGGIWPGAAAHPVARKRGELLRITRSNSPRFASHHGRIGPPDPDLDA
jgi:hypothetical protein